MNLDRNIFPASKPMTGMMPGIMPGIQPMPGMMPPALAPEMMPTTSNTSQINDRLITLERQVRTLEARIIRLEASFTAQGGPGAIPITPFQSAKLNEDNQACPYQTSMQMM